MDTPGLTLPPEYDDYRARAGGYLTRVAQFPFDWGMPQGAKNKDGMPIDFFRWDRRRFRRMVERAEHIIRCLIIWMALIRLRAGLVVCSGQSSPGDRSSGNRFTGSISDPPHPAPSRCSCGARTAVSCSCADQHDQWSDSYCPSCGGVHEHREGAECPEPQATDQHSSIWGEAAGGQNKNAPIHPLFVIRALPLYDPKLPAFRISLPEEITREDLWMQASQRACRTTEKASYRRPRNDSIHTSGLLVARMERLFDLIGEIDKRADRIAAVWARRLKPEIRAYKAELSRRIETANANDTSPDLYGLTRPELRPVKTGFPPDELVDDAPDDERDDLLALHDVALRAAELFYERCG